jgi:hypothetical protein
MIKMFLPKFQNPKGNAHFTMIHHIDSLTLKRFYQEFSPVFFLNTGRSGSAFLNNIFKHIDIVQAYHEAPPNLMMFPNFALHNQHEKILLQRIFEAARVELMLNAFIKEKVYIETNHCLVFFAHQIKSLFPNAKFVHLIRHPGDFIRSAVMKGWHKNDTIWENNRIRMMNEKEWSGLTHIEKLAWVWSSTHNFIEEFKMNCSQDVLTVKLEDLISCKKDFIKMIKFINADIFLEDMLIEKLQEEKVNEIVIHKSEPPTMFKLTEFPKYIDWQEQQKIQVRSIAGDLVKKYSYIL